MNLTAAIARGTVATGPAAAVSSIGLLLMFISLAIRAYIFTRLRHDESIHRLLENASIIGSDFLSIRLFRNRHKLTSRAKLPVYLFCYTQFVGAILLAGGIIYTVFIQN